MNRNRLLAEVSVNPENGEPRISLTKDSSEATHIASRLDSNGGHAPAVELRWPAKVFTDPQTNISYLQIDYAMTWSSYYELLTTLSKYGLVSEAFVRNAREAGATFVPLLADTDAPSRQERLLKARLEGSQNQLSELIREVGIAREQIQRLQAIIGETDDAALNPAPAQPGEEATSPTATEEIEEAVELLEPAKPC